ncbi:MAG TPA: UvrB/UvrC motif-containing protein, partial [Candidatus Norongarragalinales archaeon]|nr:UvrB/UvrC motif-containing protein [Candidatus Norongarragalinales archaeon]
MLKSGIRYAYLLLQKNPVRLTTLRRKAGQSVPKGRLFGPFPRGSDRWELIRLLRSLFFEKTGRPMTGTEGEEAYALMESVLDGKTNIEEELQKRMKTASQDQEYEKALRYKKRLIALSALEEEQIIEQKSSAHQDIFGFAQAGENLATQVFRVRFGVLREQEKHQYETLAEDPVIEFIAAYYASHRLPADIVLRENDPEKIRQIQALMPESHLFTPKSGTAAKLLSLAEKNAQNLLSRDAPENIAALQRALFLTKAPRRIEAFDISTLQGSHTVGAMVSFFDGKPDKKNNRHFNTEKPTQDDFAAMREVVFRRYDRLRREHQVFPDLILIDGGKGQLSAAVHALEDADVRIPVVALAKEFEEIYKPGRNAPYRLLITDPALKLLQRVRDEVHRFVLAFHRKKRERITNSSK